jgi:hypothetical protein
MTDDGTTERLRSSKAERLFRKQRGAGSTPVGASTDDHVIPPPASMLVTGWDRVRIYDGTGRAYVRKTGF